MKTLSFTPLAANSVARPERRISRGILTVCALALSTWGCNLVTGADSIVLEEHGGVAGSGVSGGGPSAGGQKADGAEGAGDPTVTVSESPSGEAGATMAAVDGVIMTDVVLYQGVSRPVMKDGKNVDSDTPLIEGREALMRVFYQTDAAYNGQTVTARLTIEGRKAIEVQTKLGSASTEGTLDSTINFDVPGEAMTAGMGYRVELLQNLELATGKNTQALYPDHTSFANLTVETVGKLVITLVPVKYDTDGSGRLPDTSDEQLQRYEDVFYAMYPVPEVEIKVRAQPFSWSGAVEPGGNGWELLLNTIADLRNEDGVANNEYYYGVFAPAASFGDYCGPKCVTGLGFVGNPQSSSSRAAIGLGFSGQSSVETAVHELGHNHGRQHAPCGTAGDLDPNYPYEGASIGVFGYNLVSKTLHAPESFVDMMSYCNPTWISDYTYKKLYEQAKFVNQASIHFPPHMMNRSWERVSVRADGTLAYLDDIQLVEPPLGSEITVAVETTNGTEYVSGQFFEYDHLPGGVLYVAPSSSPRAANRALQFNRRGQLNEIRLP